MQQEGGAGNALFFFCSGFTLFLGSDNSDFFNWYKNRINRIVPSLIAMSIFAVLFWDIEWNIIYTLLGGRYWFIRCILVYYLIIYPCKKYYSNKLYVIFIISAVLFGLAYCFYFYPRDISFYGDIEAGIRQMYYFLFMLLGGIMANNRDKYLFKPMYVLLLIGSGIIWYLFMALFQNSWLIALSLVPLLGICYYGYLTFTSKFFSSLMNRKVVGSVIYIIGALSLESYLIQFYLFTDKMNGLFPLNIPLMILIVLCSAYMLKMFSSFIHQTLQKEPYNFKGILIYKQ